MLCQVLHPMYRLYHHLLKQPQQQQRNRKTESIISFFFFFFFLISLILYILQIVFVSNVKYIDHINDLINNQIENTKFTTGVQCSYPGDNKRYIFLFVSTWLIICYSNESDLCSLCLLVLSLSKFQSGCLFWHCDLGLMASRDNRLLKKSNIY